MCLSSTSTPAASDHTPHQLNSEGSGAPQSPHPLSQAGTEATQPQLDLVLAKTEWVWVFSRLRCAPGAQQLLSATIVFPLTLQVWATSSSSSVPENHAANHLSPPAHSSPSMSCLSERRWAALLSENQQFLLSQIRGAHGLFKTRPVISCPDG